MTHLRQKSRIILKGKFLKTKSNHEISRVQFLGDTTAITIKCLHDKKDLKFVDSHSYVPTSYILYIMG